MDTYSKYTPARNIPLVTAGFTSLLCISFGANAVAIKISLTGFGVFTSVGLRFAIASIAISLWAAITGRSFAITRAQFVQVLILSLLFAAQLCLVYAGLSRTNASRGTLLMNVQPFFVLFLAHFFIPGDRITWKKLLGLLLGFTGMALVFLGKEGLTVGVRLGDSIILLSSLIWACNIVYTKRIIHAFDPFQIVLYPMILSVPLFFLAALAWDTVPWAHPSAAALGALLYQGLVTASFGFVAWNYLLQKYGAVSLHSFIFLMPISGVAMGNLVLGEPITMNIVFALLLIVAGILVVNLKYMPIFPQRGI